MAYCKKCGAYIPDGLTACLACGYDEVAEAEKEAKANYAYQESEEQARAAAAERERVRAEKRRAEQQEMDRKWAETEKRRREMEEDFRRRKEAEERARSQKAASDFAFTDEMRSRSTPAASIDRTWSVLSYLSFLCFLPGIMGKNDAYTRFHAAQGKRLFFAGLIATLIPGVGEIAWLAQIVLAIIGIGNAANGKKERLPIVGNFWKSLG